ncbi:MAG: hypothetical protein PVJ77_18525, partial [Desulfobacterales bacterium]
TGASRVHALRRPAGASAGIPDLRCGRMLLMHFRAACSSHLLESHRSRQVGYEAEGGVMGGTEPAGPIKKAHIPR